MKISKLFHWLYAFLMLLPVFAVGVKCGYVVLNQNANADYIGSYSFLKEENLLSYARNLTIGNFTNNNTTNYYYESPNFVSTFHLDWSSGSSIAGNDALLFNVSEDVSLSYISNGSVVNETISGVKSLVFFVGPIGNAYDRHSISLYDVTFDSSIMSINYASSMLPQVYLSNGTAITPIKTIYNALADNVKATFNSVDNKIYSRLNSGFTYIAPYLTFNLWFVDSSLSSVFYSAVDELDNVTFFSWARNSFIAQPFMYIGNLFGVPDVHPIFTFMSYWLAISIIWLVFDLFMYVPLLCHRWLDKGVIE